MIKLVSGFTLIELLVVISIIGMLSSVVLASLNSARVKARDASRIATLKQIQAAIEVYAQDHGGKYPGNTGDGTNTYIRSVASVNEVGSPQSKCGYGAPGTPGAGSSGYYGGGFWCELETALAPYISSLPDTSGNGVQPFYAFYYKTPPVSSTYNPNRVKTYGLGVMLEVVRNESKNDGGYVDQMFEIGGLPGYCKNQNSNWNSWSAVPCSCTIYYTAGCVY